MPYRAAKRPMRKDPVIFTTKVAAGNVVDGISKHNMYRSTLPIPPPRKTYNTFFIMVKVMPFAYSNNFK
jgi:hypothetical protein